MKIVFEGKEYKLIQEAYIDGTHDKPFYRANAVDDRGKLYEIRWSVKDNWEEIEDESEMCEWDSPTSVTEL